MGKIRTYEDLENIINSNSQKRKREIVSLKNICNSSDKNKNTYEQSVLLKSLVVISYSHFEGFVKDATKSYFDFLNTVSLKSNNVNLKLLSSHIQYLYLSNTLNKVDLMETVQNLLERSITITYKSDFFSDTESNLKYEVLQKMLVRSGFDGDSFLDEKVFIDNVILLNRNNFAHGDSLYNVDKEISYQIADKIIDYIDLYSNIILNAVANKSYER